MGELIPCVLNRGLWNHLDPAANSFCILPVSMSSIEIRNYSFRTQSHKKYESTKERWPRTENLRNGIRNFWGHPINADAGSYRSVMRTAAALGQSIFSAKGPTAALPAEKDSRNMFIATAEIEWVSPWNDQILMEHTFYMAFEGFRCLPQFSPDRSLRISMASSPQLSRNSGANQSSRGY